MRRSRKTSREAQRRGEAREHRHRDIATQPRRSAGRSGHRVSGVLAALVGHRASRVLWSASSLGLGAATALNDGYPWGIWIAFDVVTGTALACGGYAVALLVYIFNQGEYHPLVRPAVLTSALGYTLAGVSVVIDVGRSWNALAHLPCRGFAQTELGAARGRALHHGLHRSCSWIELSPAFLETKFGTARAVAGAAGSNKACSSSSSPLGILLPTMHQSSLGTLMLLIGAASCIRSGRRRCCRCSS